MLRTKAGENLPQAILLDLDNTLYAYAPAHKAGIDAVRRKAQSVLGLKGARFHEVYGQARAEVKAQLGSVASSYNRLLYFQRMLELLGMKTQPLMSLDFEQTYWRNFMMAARLHAGVNDFLALAREFGIGLGIVTNLTAQIQFRKLVHLGLDTAIDIVVTSEQAGANKPDAAPFLLARERMALPENAVIWMVGDDAATDLAGAKIHLNASTFLRLDDALPSQHNPAVDVCFRTFGELSVLLGELYERRQTPMPAPMAAASWASRTCARQFRYFPTRQPGRGM